MRIKVIRKYVEILYCIINKFESISLHISIQNNSIKKNCQNIMSK